MSLDDIEYRVHAILGPSAAKKWAFCTMSPTAEAAMLLFDDSRERTRYGTAGHLVLAECLEHGHDVESYLSRELLFMNNHTEVWGSDIGMAHEGLLIQHRVTVDTEMVAKTATIINFVQDLVLATGGELFVEQRLSIEHVTKERGACGTTDVGVLARRQREAIILDAKYGFLKVLAQEGGSPNLQLAMYADAFLQQYDPLGFDFDTVRLIIAQPFVQPPFNEAVFTRAELQTTIDWLAERAEKTRTAPEFNPSYEACLWCKAKATCKARDRVVLSFAAEGFEDTAPAAAERPLPTLGQIHEMLPMIEDWCATKHALIRSELERGTPIIGDKGEYKLAQGARGDRVWADPEAVAQRLRDDLWLPDSAIFSQKVASPAKIESLSVGKIAMLTKQEWKEFEATHVKRGPDGPPKIVLSTDPAPAVERPTDGFVDV